MESLSAKIKRKKSMSQLLILVSELFSHGILPQLVTAASVTMISTVLCVFAGALVVREIRVSFSRHPYFTHYQSTSKEAQFYETGSSSFKKMKYIKSLLVLLM